MRCIFHCAEDCWSEKPGKHDGPRYKKMRLDVSGDPGVFGTPHFTYFILGHVTSVSGILNILALWVLEHRADGFFFYICAAGGAVVLIHYIKSLTSTLEQ